MYDTDLPIRSDLREAHAAVVDRWTRPGTWWTAQERLAIVAEVRRARDAAEIPRHGFGHHRSTVRFAKGIRCLPQPLT
ncbi:hypothetical protein [Candidatus Poriferisodalis sp.]|uniref:hypothetical protein n=1 Tax=Candidatus Poriferisodalis sp. TaxID=3101277 RepID=UPI003D11AA47